MTPTELRAAAEVMMAAADGKEIEYLNRNHPSKRWHETNAPRWDWDACLYRVKQKPTVRPFMDSEMKVVVGKVITNGDVVATVTMLLNGKAYYPSGIIDAFELLDHWTFLDGSPCGKQLDATHGKEEM